MKNINIPPLFVQLDELSIEDNNYECWREKARWIKFEETAESAERRWSKPHVPTLTQTSIEDLMILIENGVILLDPYIAGLQDIADVTANELISYFNNLEDAKHLAELICLPHIHHFETKSKNKLRDSISNFGSTIGQDILFEKNLFPTSALMTKRKSLVDYEHSFFDRIQIEDFDSSEDVKENTKFKRKINKRSQGASILIAPINFAVNPKLVFMRLDRATKLHNFLEVNINSKFIVIILSHPKHRTSIYEIGRVIATCLADEVCSELFYKASSTEDILKAIKDFRKSSMILPPIWDPKIFIEPPEKTFTKEERKQVQDLDRYIHDEEIEIYFHTDTNLKGSKKPFFGLKNDIKRKAKHYISDFTDFFNFQCFATTCYLYLVSLCSLVAFGVYLSKKTKSEMGVVECILSGSLSGILFSLFSGQPLNILSATGPMLILEGILSKLCRENGLDFMEFRLWIGLWAALILIIFSVFNLSFLVKYITRFTEDCFAAIVAVMFIMDAIKSTFGIFLDYPTKIDSKIYTMFTKKVDFECICNSTTNSSYLSRNFSEIMFSYENSSFKSTIDDDGLVSGCSVDGVYVECKQFGPEKQYPDIFMFSLLLFTITFISCLILRNFRDGIIFPKKARQIISDFSVLITIFLMSGIDVLVGLETPKLTIPSDFKPTNPNRSWIISLFGKNSLWTIPLAIVPAILSTILIFMDQQITAVILNKKEFKLKKSYGYHLDLFIVAIVIAVESIFGFPWFVAATVLSLTHVNSLKIMSENTAPGERPSFLGVREQRMTGLLISILTGSSIFFTQILQNIPRPVLYGVFLYMGVNALNGIELFERLSLFFIPNKYQPDYPYLKHVRIKRVHLFTIIQFISLLGLILVKNVEVIAILLPVMIVATGCIRKLLDFIFSQTELFWLDDLLPTKKFNKINNQENEVMIVTPPLPSITIQDEETPSIKDTKQVSDCEQNRERKNKIQVIYVSSENDQ